jgi:hypothetical protein
VHNVGHRHATGSAGAFLRRAVLAVCEWVFVAILISFASHLFRGLSMPLALVVETDMYMPVIQPGRALDVAHASVRLQHETALQVAHASVRLQPVSWARLVPDGHHRHPTQRCATRRPVDPYGPAFDSSKSACAPISFKDNLC